MIKQVKTKRMPYYQRFIYLLCFILRCNSLAFTYSEDVKEFLLNVNQKLALFYNQEILANWYNEIQGPNNLIALLQSDIAAKSINQYIKQVTPKAEIFKSLTIEDEDIRRQLLLLPEMGYSALPDEDLESFFKAVNHLSTLNEYIIICSMSTDDKCEKKAPKNVRQLLKNSHNIKEFNYNWQEWKNQIGQAIKLDFYTIIHFYRKAAAANGFSVPSHFWYNNMERNGLNILKILEGFVLQMQPLYKQLYAYIKGQLRRKYGNDIIKENETLPQPLLELHIRQANQNLPYQGSTIPNLTLTMLQAGLNNMSQIYELGRELYKNLGMPELEKDFWLFNSQPKADTKNNQCWHKVWKFYNLKPVNLSYCPELTEATFWNMFEILSDIYYCQSYGHLITLYQEEAWPDFAQALSDFFSLIAHNSKYLEKLQVVNENYDNMESRINRLFVKSLNEVFSLPLRYVLERYRTDILNNLTDINDNCYYWFLMQNITGIGPSIVRTKQDFDIPFQLLIINENQFATEALSLVLKYQLFEYFCIQTKQFERMIFNSKTLDLCDLRGHHVVGEKVLAAMSLGASKSSKQVLRILLNVEELSATGMLSYYQPLYEWLVERNRLEDNNNIDWSSNVPCINDGK